MFAQAQLTNGIDAAAQAASFAARAASTFDIPRPVLESALMRQGGYGVYAGLPDDACCARLYQEAAERYLTATAQEHWDDDLTAAVPVREGQVRVIAVLCFEARCGC